MRKAGYDSTMCALLVEAAIWIHQNPHTMTREKNFPIAYYIEVLRGCDITIRGFKEHVKAKDTKAETDSEYDEQDAAPVNAAAQPMPTTPESLIEGKVIPLYETPEYLAFTALKKVDVSSMTHIPQFVRERSWGIGFKSR